MKQTAVEWFIQQIFKTDNDMNIDEMIYQAKEMEKQQIIHANRNGVDMVINNKQFITGEQYYNETFKSERNDK